MFTHTFRRRGAQSGFTLVEIAVVLVILAIVIAMVAVLTRGIAAGQKRSLTSTRLAGVDAALVQFVMAQKRLPCPANGVFPSGTTDVGKEVRDSLTGACTNNQKDGVVPWTTLGLTEADILDGWDRRMTFRVDPALAVNNSLDMSSCDPAGTGVAIGAAKLCNSVPPCISTSPSTCTPPGEFLVGKGLQVRNIVGGVLMLPPAVVTPPVPGAAYVVISSGESGGGAYLNTGVISPSTTADGLEEQKNYADQPMTVGSYYVDDGTTDIPGPSHFDDIVSRPAVMSVITKAGLGPRAH
jgi:prepilin-type N-terminal cleavage/methylation domain-containing protein